MPKVPDVLSTRRQNGRLSTVEREEALDRLARIVFAEGKTPSHRELAEALGLSRSAIPKLLERLYATAERERPTIGRMRETLVRRLEAQFARTLDVYTSARAQNDNRTAVEALRAGTDVLTRAGKLTGVEDARPTEGGDANKVRFVFEAEWGAGNALPPAAIAAAARIAGVSAPPGTTALPRSVGTDSGGGSGPPLGEGRQRAG